MGGAMKKLIVLLGALLVCSGCAGMERVKEEDKSFSQVYEVPGKTKDVIYEKTKIWIAQNFKSAKSVLEYENKVDGTIIGNGIVQYPCEGLACVGQSDWMMPFTMKVDVKEDKFRLTFSNLRIAWPAKTDTLGFHSASDHEMWQQGDYEKAKRVLFQFGDEIKLNMAKEAKSDK
jgi:hypothetical protein